VSFPFLSSNTLPRPIDILPQACRHLRVCSLAPATMPKVSKPHVHRVDGAVYYRESKHQASHARNHDDRARASHSNDGDRKSDLQTPSFGKCRIFAAHTRSLDYVDAREIQPEDSLSESQSPEEVISFSTPTDESGTLRFVDRSHRGSPKSPSPHPSEASTVFDRPGHDVFAGMTPNAKLEDFEFEVESVVRIDGDKCQVRWADSIVRDSDLHSRFLHDQLLSEFVAHSESIGVGLSKVTWGLTWEPVDILRSYKDVVQRESQFEYGSVVREGGGYSLVRWESSVIHKSTLKALRDRPLLSQVQSVSYPLAHRYVEVAWKPMWVPADIMEAYSG
jgi:hypothetical protein